MMKFFSYLLLLFFSIFIPNLSKSQDLKSKYDKVYNMDPELYNGMVFTGTYRGNIKGNQFFNSNEFSLGELQLYTRSYEEQLMNYDVYNQKLLLSFQDKTQASKIIEVPLDNVRSFSLYNKYFEVLDWGEDKAKIFQSFHFKNNRLLIYWSKNLKSTSSAGHNVRQFNTLKKRIYLQFNQKNYSIRKNKDLIDLYPENQQDSIKQWMKDNKIKIKKANDSQLSMLVNYLNEN